MLTEISELAITEKLRQLTVPSRLGVKTSLGPITALLDRMGHPERSFPSIHIGGTSGKGSTSTFLANILSAAGYNVGLFTKPHLQSVRERFVINHSPISPYQMVDLLDRMPADLADKPTWYELMTALAFQFFAEQKVDFGVIEVGLGGTLDATNVIMPEISILTNVGLDHTDVLGDTVELIAADKAGIIKKGRPVISGAVQPSVIEIFETKANQQGSPLVLAGRDYHYTNILPDSSGSIFDFETGSLHLWNLRIPMLGHHQVANAAAALAGAVELQKLGYAIPECAMRQALAETRVPGRMEIIDSKSTSTPILLDGAHSPPKMAALVEGLTSLFADKTQNIVGVLSFSKGHNAEASLKFLAPLLTSAVLTEFTAETDYGNKRAQDVHELAEILRALNPHIQIHLQPDPALALQEAQYLANPSDLICVTGSIFLVGQIREIVHSRGGKYVSNS